MFTRIQIQTVSWCNRSCAFCPSGKFPVAKTFMPLEDMSDWEHRFNDKLDIADLINRSGNVPGAVQLDEPLALGCERPFQQMYINHRGEAVLCCNDWRFEVVMGDTAEASLHEIWNNDKYRTYRDHLQRQDRHLPLCASCDYRGKARDDDD